MSEEELIEAAHGLYTQWRANGGRYLIEVLLEERFGALDRFARERG